MDSKKRRRIEAAGWRVGTAQEFLGLSDAEAELVEMHLRLTDEIKRRIEKAKISQARLAEELGTSAPRLSNMLAGRSVSTDALVRALIVLGASVKEVGRVIGGEKPRAKSRRRAA